MGIGVAPFYTGQKQDPAPAPGPPFVAGSANNGLSVDAVTGKIVLGNDVGDPASPAMLLSPREIVDSAGANPVIISDAVAATVQNAITSLSQTIVDLASGSSIDARILAGVIMRVVVSALAAGGVAIIAATDSLNAQAGFNVGGGTATVFVNNALQAWGITNQVANLSIKNVGGLGNGILIDPVANDVAVTGTLSTADPGSGVGKIKFGTVVAGAVAIDPNNSWEIEVNGVTKKVLLAV